MVKTCLFVCFHVNIKHESTKACMFSVLKAACACSLVLLCAFMKFLHS